MADQRLIDLLMRRPDALPSRRGRSQAAFGGPSARTRAIATDMPFALGGGGVTLNAMTGQPAQAQEQQ